MPFTLRKHQLETREVCREILSGKPVREIILSVTPGGGKSFVPVIVAESYSCHCGKNMLDSSAQQP